MRKAVAALPVWGRAVFVCLTIPATWAAEVWMGLTLVYTPQVVFGEGAYLFTFIPASVFSVAVGLGVLWSVYRTPSAVCSMAFPIVDPDTEGGTQQ